MDVKLPDEKSYLDMLKETQKIKEESRTHLNEIGPYVPKSSGERGGFGRIGGTKQVGGLGRIGGRPIKKEETDEELAKTSEMEPDTDDLSGPDEESYSDECYKESFENMYDDSEDVNISEFLGPETAAKSRSGVMRKLAYGAGYLQKRLACKQKWPGDPEMQKSCIQGIRSDMYRDIERARRK
jgi:hypothetical protein